MEYKRSINEIDYCIQRIPQEVPNKNIAVRRVAS